MQVQKTEDRLGAWTDPWEQREQREGQWSRSSFGVSVFTRRVALCVPDPLCLRRGPRRPKPREVLHRSDGPLVLVAQGQGFPLSDVCSFGYLFSL